MICSAHTLHQDKAEPTDRFRLIAILAGAQAPKETVLPLPIITKDNAVKFCNRDSVF